MYTSAINTNSINKTKYLCMNLPLCTLFGCCIHNSVVAANKKKQKTKKIPINLNLTRKYLLQYKYY